MSEQIASLFAAIGGDTSALDAALGESQDRLTGFESTLAVTGAATDEFGAQASGAADGLGDFTDGLDELSESSEAVGGQQDSLKQQLRGLNETLLPVNLGVSMLAQAFDTARDAAEDMGRTDVVDKIDGMYESIGDLKNQLLSLPIPLIDLSFIGIESRGFVDWMGDAASGATDFANAIGNADIFLTAFTGAELTAEQQARALSITHQDVTLTTEQLSQAQADAADPLDETNRLLSAQALAAGAAAAAEAEANAAAETAAGVWGMAQAALEASNVPLNSKIDLLDELAIKLGQTTEEELAQKDAVDFLTKQLELGNINIDEWNARVDAMATGATTAAETIHDVSDAINGIPDRDVYINYHNQVYGSEPGGEAPVVVPDTDSGTGGAYGGAQASGGDYIVSTPTWFLAGEAGPERATFTPGGGMPDAGRETPRAGDTYHVTINDQRAYAMWAEDQRRQKLARANALMGM